MRWRIFVKRAAIVLSVLATLFWVGLGAYQIRKKGFPVPAIPVSLVLMVTSVVVIWAGYFVLCSVIENVSVGSPGRRGKPILMFVVVITVIIVAGAVSAFLPPILAFGMGLLCIPLVLAKGSISLAERVGVTVIIMVLAMILWPALRTVRRINAPTHCALNLSALGKAMLIYANEYGAYPAPCEWCDILLRRTDATPKQFNCDAKPDLRCGYAMNPNCDPNSSASTILLFDARGAVERSGWNNYGGRELVAPENHDGDGCNILFNDGSVAFVRGLERILKENWGDEPNGHRKPEAVAADPH